MTEDEMAGQHHRLDGHGFGWTPGVGDGQEDLVCCGSWGCKESDTTERLSDGTELEKGLATHSSILAWRIPWTEEPGRLQSMGSQKSDMTQLLNNHHSFLHCKNTLNLFWQATDYTIDLGDQKHWSSHFILVINFLADSG